MYIPLRAKCEFAFLPTVRMINVDRISQSCSRNITVSRNQKRPILKTPFKRLQGHGEDGR